MNDQALIRRAKRGDDEAFIGLISRYRQSLYKVGRAYFREEQDVADAMQEAILSAWTHLDDLRKPRYFKTWLTRIMINSCNAISNARQSAPLATDMLELEAASVGCMSVGDIERCESSMAFDELLRLVPSQYRVAFVLYYGEGFTASEVAGILGMNENTVRSWLSRGRKAIRENLKRDGEAESPFIESGGNPRRNSISDKQGASMPSTTAKGPKMVPACEPIGA